MESPMEAVNRQIKAEKDRHNNVINNLNSQKERENKQHEQTMRMLNSRKEQIKRTIKLEHMEETLNKATEDFNG